jgi:hypothetical protein
MLPQINLYVAQNQQQQQQQQQQQFGRRRFLGCGCLVWTILLAVLLVFVVAPCIVAVSNHTEQELNRNDIRVPAAPARPPTSRRN